MLFTSPQGPFARIPTKGGLCRSAAASAAAAADRVFRHALGRAPSPDERRIAETAVRDPARPERPSADGLADVVWSLLMKPEFQFIH